ncbi:hypothetical protein ANTQUA_LOCUS3129 [Anthophora quadrimaculata]
MYEDKRVTILYAEPRDIASPAREANRPILRGLAELYGAVSEPSCGLIEEGIKGADGHCLAFSAGPTFATCIAAPSASRWAS